MRDVLDYLETLGGDACASGPALDAAGLHHLDAAVREPLLAGDAAALRQALGLAPVLACMISVPNDDENEFEDEPSAPDEQPDDAGARAA